MNSSCASQRQKLHAPMGTVSVTRPISTRRPGPSASFLGVLEKHKKTQKKTAVILKAFLLPSLCMALASLLVTPGTRRAGISALRAALHLQDISDAIVERQKPEC